LSVVHPNNRQRASPRSSDCLADSNNRQRPECSRIKSAALSELLVLR